MGLERFEAGFLTLFSIDQTVFPNWPKIANASHDDFYLRIFVKIFPEGRRQDFMTDHKVKLAKN